MSQELSSAATSTSPGQPSYWKWWICLLLLLATTLNYMDRMALNQTASDIMFHFQLDNERYGWLEGTFSFAFAIGALTVGYLVDKGNVRWIYPGIVLLWSISGFATGYASTFWALLLCRFCLGLFEAGNWPCGVLTIRRVLPPEQRSLGNGMFQSGTALGAIITPLIVLGCLSYFDPGRSTREPFQVLAGSAPAALHPAPAEAWQSTFRIIGAVGILWVILWLATVRSHHVAAPKETAGNEVKEPFTTVLKDRRFWILVLMIIAVNSTWHSFRVWLPLFLQKQRGYSKEMMNLFSSLYYLTADIGAITVGIMTIWFSKRGRSVYTSRMIVFGFCAALTLLTGLAAFLPKGLPLLGVLLLIAFGALGLFPTYFAFSQELSSRHQGKVTGTLGCINALYLALLFPLQGKLIDQMGSYTLALGMAGFPPLISFVVIALFWNRKEKPATNGS